MVTMTLVTIPLMDRVGRRTLHLVGLAGIIVCSIMITIAFNYSSQDKQNNKDDNKGIDVPTLPNLVDNKTMDNNEAKEESATGPIVEAGVTPVTLKGAAAPVLTAAA